MKIKDRLYPFLPRFRDPHFWAIQGWILAIMVVHYLIEARLLLPELESSLFVPVALFFIPVMYAALRFGFAGSVSTAIWVTAVTIPNLAFLHHGLALLGEIFQLLTVNVAAVFLGYYVDRERMARQRAKAYAARLVKALEEQRQQIARDLHDGSIQTLVQLCQKLDAVKNDPSMSREVTDELQKARDLAEQTATELREFARELRPPILDDLGMVAAVRKLLMDVMYITKAEGRLKIVGYERRLPPDLETGMFRITQEALKNVTHHARATSVIVTITFADKKAVLDICDNGQGFIVSTQLDNAAAGNKLGLVGIRERIEQFGGRLEIQSSPGKGTRIKASIPLPGSNEANDRGSSKIETAY